MKQNIQDVLQNREDNYIYPFFWQHGEEESVLREYMGAIQAANIGAVAVESRPHPDFCGPRWFQDMDVIMDEARKRNMKVWVLDMAHIFNGNMHMDDEYPQLAKQYLAKQQVDVTGPMPQVEIDTAELLAPKAPMGPGGPMGGMPGASNKVFDDNRLLSVMAWELGRDDVLVGSPLDLTGLVKDGSLRWDVPQGRWRVYVLYITRNGGGNSAMPNLLDAQSCRVIIDKVYEPHYQHYKDDFGKTFVGFFADEPMIGNTNGYNFTESIGRYDMQLPWCSELEKLMPEKLGDDWTAELPRLWQGSDAQSADAKARYHYMDLVTRLVQKNFSEQIGSWCRERGVDFVGHVIEDQNQHTRLGAGMGHFFRGISGQDFGGIDDIGNQVFPGGEDAQRMRPGDGSFYHYVLGKLAASSARVDPKKKDRSLCEIFGAYGWQEGIREMKYLADHFMIRGVNYYVPHAFTPKAFPDPEFPPHFYAHGHNPQYRHFGALMKYMNRICHLMSGGRRVAPVALLYFAEMEWCGDYHTCDAAARLLSENQLDYDIVPADVFAEPQRYMTETNGKLVVNGNEYKALVVPGGDYIPKEVAEFAASGFPVLFLDSLPKGTCDGSGALPDDLRLVTCHELIPALEALGLRDVQVKDPWDKLTYAHYSGDGQMYMFSNESVCQAWSGQVQVANAESLVEYDAMNNLLRPLEVQDGLISLHLEPAQSVVLISRPEGAELTPAPGAHGVELALTGPWKVSFCSGKEYPQFKDAMELDQLVNMAVLKPEFSGYMAYETTFVLDKASDRVSLCLEHVFEGCQVWVNGQDAGMCIARPYNFDLTGLVQPGENTLRIEVANSFHRYMRKNSQVMGAMGGTNSSVEPAGLFGKAAVYVS